MLGLSTAASFAFAALTDDRIPNEEAIALSPTVGWLMLGAAVFAYLIFALQNERWRRFWLTKEDPRPIALFRIVFAFLCICNINDLWEYFEFLFTDEGIFLSDAARQLVASGQFKGFGDGIGNDPHGFFDAAAWLEFLKGQKYSLLYFWDTPRAMWIQMLAFYGVTIAFMLGWRTRLMGVLSFMLMNSFFLRNHLFWEGTELVYRVFFFYLLLAKSGHAYSIDNWLRTRKLRRQGLLSERNGPGGGAGVAPSPEHPQGLAAVYRLIPTWPRMLMVLNLGVLYCYTGTVKNGAVWAKGDALYYALNMDHFYRFYPQEISSVLGLNLFRLATWVTHWWEALFPLMIVGLITRWGIREQLAPLQRWRLWAVRACWLGFGLMCMVVVLVTFPVHYVAAPGWWTLQKTQWAFALGWLALMAAIGTLWWGLGTGRMSLKLRGTRHVLDRDWFCRWFLGRRIWLTLGLMFHGNLQMLMNIGMFPPIMMSTYLFCFQGDEPGRILRFFGRGLARMGVPMPDSVRRGEPPLPAEDRTLPHHQRDGRKLPDRLVYGLIALTVFGIWLQAGPLVPWLKTRMFALDETAAAAATGLHFGWTVVALVVILILYTYIEGHRGTRGFVARLLAISGGLVAYLWLMNVEIPDPVEAETWKFIRVGVNAFIVLILVLQQIPAVHRGLAAIGLSFTAPGRGPVVPDVAVVDAHSGRPRAPWAYGPGGRMLAGFLVVYHITAIAFWELPEKDSVSTFRIKGRDVFNTWVMTTQTDQQWGMFAPNPPRHNVLMRVVLTDETGEQWDLRTDTYAIERRPIPWVWNDRMRKMNRRIIGGESGKGDWYQKWYARYLCREWARTHRGVMPQKIELFKLTYKMPSPEMVARQGWYHPDTLLHDTGREERQYTEKCTNAIHGQLPNFIRTRHGIPLLDEKVFKAWVKDKKKAWDKRLDPPATPASKTDAKTTAAARIGSVSKAGAAAATTASAAGPAGPASSAPKPGAN
jgi:hypothetical protein